MRAAARFGVALTTVGGPGADIQTKLARRFSLPLGPKCNCGLHAFVSIVRSSTRTTPVRVARQRAMPFCRTGSMWRNGGAGVGPLGRPLVPAKGSAGRLGAGYAERSL